MNPITTAVDVPGCAHPEPTTFTIVPSFDRILLRALMDIPAFADHVIPVLDADLFDDSATAAVYTFVAEDYQRHHIAPDFHVLRLRNDRERGHTEATVKAVDAVIRELESMTPIQATQLPILLKDTEAWVRTRKVHSLLSRIVQADETGTDPRPLTDQLKAVYDWRFADSPTGRYVFDSLDTLLNSTPAPFLVQNLIMQNSLVALVSPPGGNKTFLALDLALSIASGQSTWLGEPLHLSGPVVYVLGEGGGRFKLRVLAWNEQHGIVGTYPFYCVNEPVALTNTTDANAFVQGVAALKPVLVVFDTLSRCLAGADENSQKDMSAAVNVCDRLRQQLGCSVLLLHHTTKNGEVERGSSVLRGAVDTLLVLKVPDASEPHFTMTCEKQKDAETFAAVELTREKVTLASELDPHTGQPAVSCVVKVASTAQVTQHADKRLWKAQQFMVKRPHASKTELAELLGGRKKDRLRDIDEWVSRGDLSFRRRRQPDLLASLKAEQMTVCVDSASSHFGSRELVGN